MRYFIHCDNSFRKHKLVSSKLDFLDSRMDDEEDERKLDTVTFFYGYTYSKLNDELSKINIRLNRRNPDEIAECLTYCDCVVLFHNFVEYCNGMQDIIDACMKEFIPLVIYSDHIKKGFLSNGSGELTITQDFPQISKRSGRINMPHFNFEPYRYIPNQSIDKTTALKQVIELTRRNYEEFNEEKSEKRIKYHNLPR